MSEAPLNPPAPTRLRALTRRVPRRPTASAASGDDDADPGEISPAPEPNVRLSRALVVMLLLHVVAIGGVLAFGHIKERPAGNGDNRSAAGGKPRDRGPRPGPGEAGPEVADHAPTPFPAGSPRAALTPVPASRVPTPPPLSRGEADAVRLIESGGPLPPGGGERTYVVGRGENIQTIAQKLRVEAASLLRLNNIDDPRKIQPGQRLRVPPVPGRARS